MSVLGLIERHTAATGSAIGKQVLDEWTAMARQFVVVMPRDFKRVRAEEAAKARGMVA